jgi:hypothetical protein
LIKVFAQDLSLPYRFCHSSKVIPGIFITRPHLAYQFDLVMKYKHYAEIDTEPFRLMTEKQVEEKLQSGSKRREPNNHCHAFWQTLYKCPERGPRDACRLQKEKKE